MGRKAWCVWNATGLAVSGSRVCDGVELGQEERLGRVKWTSGDPILGEWRVGSGRVLSREVQHWHG